MPSPVGRVATVSTGRVRIHPQHERGSRLPAIVWLMASRAWGPPRPINVFVIEHPLGLTLFDTGQDRRSITDPDYYPTSGLAGLIYRRTARFEIGPDETVPGQLKRLGYDVGDVRHVVLSHLHQDHIGGLRDLVGARFVTTVTEWGALVAKGSETYGYLPHHTDLPGARWDRVDFRPTASPDLAPFDRAVDVLGDESLVLVPTPGHTPGSASMLVRTGTTPLLLVGDLTYGVDLMHEGRVPGVGNAHELRSTTERVLEFERRHPGLAILPAHDPGTATRLATATATRT